MHGTRLSLAAKLALAQFEDFLSANELAVCGPNAPTFFSNNGSNATLDYIVCKKRYASSVFSARVVRHSPIKSDHRVVVAELFIHFAKVEMTEMPPKQDFGILADKEVNEQFATHFSQVSTYEQFVHAFKSASLQLPHVNPKQARRTFDTDLAKRCAEIDRQLGTHNLPVQLLQQDNAHVTELVRQYAHLLRDSPRLAWRNIRSCSFSSQSSAFPAHSAEERMDKLTAHFKKLFSGDGGPGPPNWGVNSTVPHFRTGVFSAAELDSALKTIQNNKSPGSDSIPNEVLRIANVRSVLLRILNDAYIHGPPEQWRETILVPLPKKGDLSDVNNWRGIALMQTSAKLFDLLLLLRLRDAVDQSLNSSQNGFRRERSTSMHIIALKMLIDEAKLRKMPLHCTFVDFKKAFDSVSWVSVKCALQFWHVPSEIIEAVFSIYCGHHLRVRCGQELGEDINVSKGVLQGDTLAPYLFVLVVDQLLRRLPNCGIDVSIGQASSGTASRPRCAQARDIVNALAYADDIALVAHSATDLQMLFSSLEAHGAEVGLFMNLGKGKTERFVMNDIPGSLRTVRR